MPDSLSEEFRKVKKIFSESAFTLNDSGEDNPLVSLYEMDHEELIMVTDFLSYLLAKACRMLGNDEICTTLTETSVNYFGYVLEHDDDLLVFKMLDTEPEDTRKNRIQKRGGY